MVNSRLFIDITKAATVQPENTKRMVELGIVKLIVEDLEKVEKKEIRFYLIFDDTNIVFGRIKNKKDCSGSSMTFESNKDGDLLERFGSKEAGNEVMSEIHNILQAIINKENQKAS